MNAIPQNRCDADERDGCTVLRVAGEVDLSWSQQVRDAILAALRRGDAYVELAQVAYIDSSGIAALVEGFQAARGNGARFALLAPSQAVLAVLQLARLDKVFPLFGSLDEARAA